MANVLVLASSNSVWLVGMSLDGETYPVNATVVLTKLMDSTGATVTGTAGLAMPYISGTGANSIYRGVIPHTVTLAAGTYTAVVTATSVSNVRVFTLACTADTAPD